MKLLDFPPDAPVAEYPAAPALPPFEPLLLTRHNPDGHCLVLDGGEAVARASLWWNQTPPLEGEQLGVIGHFAACDRVAAVILLARLTTRLAAQGCTLAVGPMDGNTWRSYRFVTDPGSEPAFFLEPENPPAYPHYFLDAGFLPLADYSSALVTDLTVQDARVPRTNKRLISSGIRWRSLNMDRFEDELKAIYQLSLQSFAQNFLYTPIGEAEFTNQYQQVAPYLNPQLTLMAEQDNELLGFLFGIPDIKQVQRGEPVDTLIVKTVAVLPGRRSAGLGSVLVGEGHRIAHEQGYRRAIHALMHTGNKSRNLSSRYARSMRRYTLFQRRLGNRV